MKAFFQLFGADFLSATLRMASALLFPTLGVILNERSGVINIGVEGMMLMGAFVAVLGSHYLGNPWWGLLGGVVAAGFVALVHAFMSISLKVNQIVSGAAINIVCLGLTSFLIRVVFGLEEQQRTVPHLTPWRVPYLADVPGLGSIFFAHIVLVYLAFLLVPILAFVLYRTRWGLMIVAAGEHPRAADTVGINPDRLRYVCTVLSGMAAGVGGASLSIGHLHFFVDDMVAGRGFMALAAVIFGRWDPLGGLLACLLFGGAEALQVRVQGIGLFDLPHQLVLMLPYVLTLLILLFLGGRAQGPAALGIPYRKEAE